jgi:hypothetical protein
MQATTKQKIKLIGAISLLALIVGWIYRLGKTAPNTK